MDDDHNSEIEVLEWLEAVRRRPGMWVGSRDARGVQHLVWELVCDALDDLNTEYCLSITVTNHADGSISVEDNGRGIPIGVSEKTGQTWVDVFFTTLGCPTGYALAAVNALSEELEVEVFRDGKRYATKYQRGKLITPLEFVAETSRHGKRVTSLPDRTIFVDAYLGENIRTVPLDDLSPRLRDLAFLNRNLRIEVIDLGSGGREVIQFNGGINDYVRLLNEKQSKLNDEPIYFCAEHEIPGENDSLFVECSLQWTNRIESVSLVFFNNDPIDEKFSIHALSGPLAVALNEYAKTNNLLPTDASITDAAIAKGLSSVLAVKSAKNLRWLDKEYLGKFIKAFVQNDFLQYLQGNKAVAVTLIESLRAR